TGYDMPEQMYFYGNPAAQIWRSVMAPIHEGLEWKSFPSPTYVGGDTMIFGDLSSPSPSPTPSEEPQESAEPGGDIEPTEPVEPAESTPPGGDESDPSTEDD